MEKEIHGLIKTCAEVSKTCKSKQPGWEAKHGGQYIVEAKTIT